MDNTPKYLDRPTPQAETPPVVPDAEGTAADDRPAAYPRMRRNPPSVRLRLADGPIELADVEAHSAAELAERFAGLQRAAQERLLATSRLAVYLWHGGAWWNLSDDLAHAVAWHGGAVRATPDEIQRFAGAPLSRFDWLYEAARQMQRLLEAASMTHPETNTLASLENQHR